MSTNIKKKLIAGYFLLETTLPQQVEESDSEDELNTREKKYCKKTKSREQRLEKDKKRQKKKLRKRMERGLIAKDFFPIDQIINA